MNEYLINLDTEIFLLLNSYHNEYFDMVMRMISGKLTWGLMYLAIIYSIYRNFGARTTAIMLVMTALAVTAADQVSASMIRPLATRLRPANPDNPISELVHIVGGYRGGAYGFPSCHAANTFATATIMSLLFRRWRFSLFIYIWAIANCYSRIYLGVHYPGDLLAGLLVGCFCGGMAYLASFLMADGLQIPIRPGKQPINRRTALSIDGLSYEIHPSNIPIFVGMVTLLFILLLSTSL